MDEPFEDFVRQQRADLLAGKLDDKLVYRKRLRRDLDDYTGSAPPHVQAARQLERQGRHVEYVITVNGPEALSTRRSRLDYQHYLTRQLAPAADAILHFRGTSFMQLGGPQLSLF
jgi:DNA polymerase-2